MITVRASGSFRTSCSELKMSKDHARRAEKVDAGTRALAQGAPGVMRAFARCHGGDQGRHA
jgi:hypothetical protein